MSQTAMHMARVTVSKGKPYLDERWQGQTRPNLPLDLTRGRPFYSDSAEVRNPVPWSHAGEGQIGIFHQMETRKRWTS